MTVPSSDTPPHQSFGSYQASVPHIYFGLEIRHKFPAGNLSGAEFVCSVQKISPSSGRLLHIFAVHDRLGFTHKIPCRKHPVRHT